MTVRDLSRRYGRWLEKLAKHLDACKHEREKLEIRCGVLRLREGRIAQEIVAIREELQIEKGVGA